MEQKFPTRVLRSTPDGKIRRIEAKTIRQLVDETTREVAGTTTLTEKAKKLLSMAETCRDNDYPKMALDLYLAIFDLCVPDAITNHSFRNKELLLQAARGIDRIYSRTSSSSASASQVSRIRMLYLTILDDYLYTQRNIDDEALLNSLDPDLVEDLYARYCR